ncbi:MAG: Mov34/MPN/PAD-1 family protein [Actinomycetota bacterium]
MDIRIPSALVDEMISHLESERPNEGCGLFGARDGEIVKVFRMGNASASPVRYSLDPKQQFAVYQKLEEEGWELGGVYHSHTHTEAFPSPTDVRLASEDVPYVIVSLAENPPSIRAFRIVKENLFDEGGEIVEVPVTVIG